MKLKPTHTFVVYDAKTGDVVQVHHFSAMPGASVPHHARLREIALEQAAAKHNRDAAGLAVLESAARAFEPKTAYVVDIAEQRLRPR